MMSPRLNAVLNSDAQSLLSVEHSWAVMHDDFTVPPLCLPSVYNVHDVTHMNNASLPNEDLGTRLLLNPG